MSQDTMVKNEVDDLSIKDVASVIKKVLRYLLSRWIIILIISLIGGIAGFLYASSKPATYTAVCNFVMEEGTKSGGLGQYAGLASLAGIDLGASSGLFQGDNILELYKSYNMIRKTLLTPAKFPDGQKLLIDKYIGLNNLRKAWGEQQPKIKNINFNIPESQFTLQHDSIIKSIVADINKKYLTVDRPNKKLTIINVSVKSKDEYFSKEFTDHIVQNVNSFYIQTKIKNAAQDVVILEHQSDSVRRVLNTSISGVAAANDATPNANPYLQVLHTSSQKKQIDVAASQAVYAQIVQNLEMSRISLRRELPLIQIVDEPVLPLDAVKPSKVIYFLAGFMGMMFLTAFFITASRYLQVMRGRV